MKVIEFQHSVTALARPTLPKRENFSAIIYIKVSYDDENIMASEAAES